MRDLGRDTSNNEAAQVIGELTINRLGAIVDDSSREDFLDSLPKPAGLELGARSKDVGRLVGFGKEDLQAKMPDLRPLGFSSKLRKKIMLEYLRYHLLRHIVMGNKGDAATALSKGDILTLLNKLNSAPLDKAVDIDGNFTTARNSNPGNEQDELSQALAADSELFVDILVALAARVRKEMTLEERWKKILKHERSIEPDREAGATIHVTDEDNLPHRPYRLKHRDNDLAVADSRLKMIIEELTPDAIIPLEEEKGNILTVLGQELRGWAEKRESLRASVRSSLEDISSSLGILERVPAQDFSGIISALESIFVRIEATLSAALSRNSETVIAQMDAFEDGETVPRLKDRINRAKAEHEQLSQAIKMGLRLIYSLKSEINRIKDLRGRQMVMAAAQLQIDARTKLKELQNILVSK